MTDCTLTLADETVKLLPERALYHPAERTLYIADTHIGKAETFHAHAMPVPSGAADDWARLSSVVQRTEAQRLVILGDLLHTRRGRAQTIIDAGAAWRQQHAALDVILVRGNHDAGAGDPPASWRITCYDAPVTDASPFIWQHYPDAHPDGFALAGHLHPTVRLRGRAKQQLKLPCFHSTAQVMTLPAFSTFTDGATITPASDDRVFVVTPEAVIPR